MLLKLSKYTLYVTFFNISFLLAFDLLLHFKIFFFMIISLKMKIKLYKIFISINVTLIHDFIWYNA